MGFLGAGRAVQSAVFGRGVSGFRPAVPTSPRALEEKATKEMSPRARAYVFGGAGAERTVSANREALDRVEILPRMLRDTTGADMSTTLFGKRLDSPLLVAPIGAAGLLHRNSDVAVGEAAATLGVPYILSSQGSQPMEEVARAMGDAPRWFQLYWPKDPGLVRSFVARAEAMGAGAIVLTADTTQLGWRPRDLDLGYLPFTRGIGIAQYTSDPRFSELVAERIARSSSGAEGEADTDVRPTPTPEAIATLLRISRNHPGYLLDNLRSPVPRAAVQ
ncbi:alpha-hydroxy-acid oxidizing protein, partial [Dietzia sp.]|uniref:alpha-hydroxy-acid oxidizing protein n=1 Tax=Dietzia sp. TaxID=1871616 RepID=UPI002FD9DA13